MTVIKVFLEKALLALRKLGSVLLWILSAILGRWQWDSPSWMIVVKNLLLRFCALLKRHPKASLASSGLLVLLAMGGVLGYRWYQAIPKPVYPSCSVTAPELTRWVDDKAKIYPLVVECDQSVAPLEAVGKPVVKGVEISPKVAGQWQWSSDRKLVFTPAADWPIGQAFTLTLAEEHFLAAQIHLAKYAYEFRSAPFVAHIAETQFYQDPQDPSLKKLVATVHFSHSVDAEEFEQHIELKLAKDAAFLGLGADSVKYTVNYDKHKLNAYVHSHSLNLPRENTPMSLLIKKGIHASKGGDGIPSDLTGAITIPGRFSLRLDSFDMILADNEKLEPEQVLLFQSQAPVPDAALDKHIQAWLLPEHHPDPKKDGNANYPHNWSDRDVDKKVLAAAETLLLTLLPSDDPEKQLHSYRFLAPVGRYLYIKIDAGIAAIGGTQTAEPTTYVLPVKPYERSLKMLGEGAILGLNGERKLGLVARAVDGVKVEVGRLLPNQLHQLMALTNGSLIVPSDYYDNNAQEDRLVERFTENRALVAALPGKPMFDHVDLSPYFNADKTHRSKLGVFLVRVSGLKANEDNQTFDESSYSDASDSRLLLVTDLGILTKRNLDGSQDVFVQSIAKGGPVAGATVELIGRNGIGLESRITDASGHCTLPKMADHFTREQTPLMITVRQGDDLAFLPNRYDRSLNYSRFDVGGIDTKLDPKSLSAFIFSDRGMYRPGEDIHLGSILRTQDWQAGLEGIPLVVEINDPRDRVVYRETITANATGFNEINWKTQTAAPTGQYSASLYLVDSNNGNTFLGSTTIRVQEFEPDRLKVSASLTAKPVTGWLTPPQVTAKVLAMNLFGTPAINRRVTAEMTLSPAIPSFARYPDYRFYDPRSLNEQQAQSLNDGQTDAQGEATFDLNLTRFATATYRLSLLARVFEPEGGRNVAAVSDVLVSSAAYLVGVKKTDADVTYLTKSSPQSSQWQAINAELNGMALDGLTLDWVQRKFVSVLVKQSNGTYRYQSRLKETLRDSHPQNLLAKGSEIALPTDEPGDFALVLRTAEGQELNRLQYSVVGLGNLSRSLERSAELQIKLNKTEYLAGDTIELAIQAPYTGAGLITIERDKVYIHQWFKTDTTSSVQKITIPDDFEGNGYITVQYVRDVTSDEVFTSPLSYGVVPFKMSLAQRTQTLEIKAASLVKPGENLAIQLSGTRKGKAVVYAVDEGILQVAHYQTPEPLAFFFQKRRLEVESAQILDLLLPEFSQLLKASAPGGDGDAALGRNLNPFKNKHKPPVAFWSGLVDVSPAGTTLNYPVPDYYNGKLHIYAVAVDAESIGVNEANTEVRGDLIITPNVPLMLSPGDEVDVSYGLANNLKTSTGTVDVTLKPSEHLEIVGDAVQHLSIEAGKEGVGSFRVRAKDAPGAASLVFTASIGASKAQLQEDLSVRPPVPYRTAITASRSTVKQQAVNLSRSLYDPFRTVSFASGYSPLAWTQGLQQYLDDYPYGCTEQLVSMGLPALLFSQHPELGQLKGKGQVSDVIRVLQTRQNEEGAFGLWSASTHAEHWPSLWAIQFLVEAKDRGQKIPPDLFSHANQWLDKIAKPWGNSLGDMRERAYAIYLLSRQGVQTGALLSSLLQELNARYPKEWQQDIAAAYVAASQRLLQQTDLAEKTLKAVPWKTASTHYELYYDHLGHQSQLLYLYAKHFPERLTSLPDNLFDGVAEQLNNRRYASLSAGSLLLALTQYGEAAKAQSKAPLKLSAILQNGSAQAFPFAEGLLQMVAVPKGSKSVQIQQDNPLALFYSLTESGFDRQGTATAEVKNGLEIQREFLDLTGHSIEKVTVGQEFLVRLRVRAIDQANIDQVAVVDMLPGGIEPVINRLVSPQVEGNESGDNSDSAHESTEEESTEEESTEEESTGEESTDEGAAEVATAVNNDGAAGNNNGAVSQALGEDIFIAGFSGEPRRSTWHADFADLRDDRVVIYGSLSRDMVTFTYRVRATNTGEYQVPAAYAEAMYNPAYFTRAKPGHLSIVKP